MEHASLHHSSWSRHGHLSRNAQDLYSLFIIAKFLLHLVHTHRLKMATFDADCHPLESGAFPEAFSLPF